MPKHPASRVPDREQELDALESRTFDLLVVGGGITGAGIAREAARGGLSTALVEARDFASGTSSRSSKLIHGGLRYLAQGDVALVRETALERRRVRELAPHLAEPCWMLVPTRSWAGLVKFRAALGTYEKLGAIAEADRHRRLDAEALAREEPLLRRDRYPHGCLYREYVTEDARLVLANLRDARARGAVVANHLAVESFELASGRVAGAVARCALGKRQVRVRARAVVNAAGPWVEAVRHLEDPGAETRLQLSKGVHVVLPAERVPVRHIVILSAPDRRSLFAVRREDVVYVGTTDTFYTGQTAEAPAIDRADVAYLLEPLHGTFAIDPVAPGECIGAWSGLRPLLAQPGKRPSELSRRDEIWVGPGGVIHIAGGKLTGYRRMAHATLAAVARALGEPSASAADPDPPLPGGDFDGDLSALAAGLARRHGLEGATAARLARLYGTESEALLAVGSDALVPGGRVRSAEVDWAVREEGALHLDDLISRRLRAPLYLPREVEGLLEPAAARMATLLDWDAARRESEIAHVTSGLARDLAFRKEPAPA